MKFGFKFSNLCGVVHKKGNLVFTPDGYSLLSAVGNRVTVFDLRMNTSLTLPFENRKDIKRIALSPNATLLITVDEDGHAIISNFYRKVVLAYFNFKAPVRVIKFSPDGNFIAAAIGSKVEIWRTPSLHKEFAPFVLYKAMTPHQDQITSLEWHPSSNFIITGSKDFTVKISPVNLAGKKTIGFGKTFLGYRQYPVGTFFGQNDQVVVVLYNSSMDTRQWNPHKKTWANSKSLNTTLKTENKAVKALTASYNLKEDLLLVGLSDGTFQLFKLPEFEQLQALALSDRSNITASAISPSGDWLAFASAINSSLCVYEWLSETYILKQQGHAEGLTSLTYSGDGALIATGGEDGKVKLWNSLSGYCFVTFSDHQGSVTAVKFSANTKNFVLFSASLDGTVRAYDLYRYRNFRTFIAGDKNLVSEDNKALSVQFSCLATDPSGEIICAGTQDSFEIFLWTVQTGQLLDVFSGHQAPVSSLLFNPVHSVLVSGSWDKTVRMWEVYSGGDTGNAKESLTHQSDVTAVAFRPDGSQLCSASLDGSLNFWDTISGEMIGSLDGRKDIQGGRQLNDARSMKNSPANKYFTTVCYTSDGEGVLAGGNSKYVCLYAVTNKFLLKKFEITRNLSLDGVLDILNSKALTEAGRLELLDLLDHDDDEIFTQNQTKALKLPGVNKGTSKRTTPPAIATRQLEFSPTGRGWGAVTTEGLLLYSLDDTLIFDPFDLDLQVTPDNLLELLANKQYLPAFVMSFRLNEENLIREVYRNIPPQEIQLLVQSLPVVYLPRLMSFLGKELEDTKQLERELLWCVHLLSHNASYLQDLKMTSLLLPSSAPDLVPVSANSKIALTAAFRLLQKNLHRQMNDLSKLSEANIYSLDYLGTVSKITNPAQVSHTKTPAKREISDDLVSQEDFSFVFESNWTDSLPTDDLQSELSLDASKDEIKVEDKDETNAEAQDEEKPPKKKRTEKKVKQKLPASKKQKKK
jgi:periodic tryptophan protein 2